MNNNNYYTVAIRKNDTQEIRHYREDWNWYKNGPDGDLFWWTEGNMGCDCNLYLCFERAGGNDINASGDEECGDTAYTALYASLPDGTTINLLTE